MRKTVFLGREVLRCSKSPSKVRGDKERRGGKREGKIKNNITIPFVNQGRTNK